jgi:hypothetical protein
MRTLREFVEEVLQEDLEGFVKDTSGIMYAAGSTAVATLDKKTENKSKEVKRIWAKNADHAFMKSLNKVHWFQAGSSLALRLKWFLNSSGKDEVATSAYLPGTPMKSSWGSVGVLLDGRVTLAANSMDTIVSGYSGDFYGMEDKYKSSGTPKRAGVFGTVFSPSADYVLDSESFKPSEFADNEFIVDNWKVKSLVVGSKSNEYPNALSQVISLAKQSGIPMLDEMGNPLK